MRMKEIVPGVFVESAFPPYNLVLIQSENSAIVVDIPPNPLDAMRWRETVLAQVDRIDFLVLTDANPERQLVAMLWESPIIASETTYQMMAAYDEERSRRDFVQHFIERYPEGSQFVDEFIPRRPTIACTDRFLLHTRTPPIQFESVDGAAPGSLWVVLPEWHLLIAGDTVSGNDVPAFDHLADSKAWLSTLSMLSRRSTIKKIVPGRGTAPILRGDIEKQREVLRVMRRTARKLSRAESRAGKVTQAAEDLGQVFYNNKGHQAVKQIKKGLEKLMLELREEAINVLIDTDNDED